MAATLEPCCDVGIHEDSLPDRAPDTAEASPAELAALTPCLLCDGLTVPFPFLPASSPQWLGLGLAGLVGAVGPSPVPHPGQIYCSPNSTSQHLRCVAGYPKHRNTAEGKERAGCPKLGGVRHQGSR